VREAKILLVKFRRIQRCCDPLHLLRKTRLTTCGQAKIFVFSSSLITYCPSPKMVLSLYSSSKNVSRSTARRIPIISRRSWDKRHIVEKKKKILGIWVALRIIDHKNLSIGDEKEPLSLLYSCVSLMFETKRSSTLSGLQERKIIIPDVERTRWYRDLFENCIPLPSIIPTHCISKRLRGSHTRVTKNTRYIA